ncbi:MAG: ABC transporter ATP-binding protein [Lapillicoccus sp.]
MLELRDIGFAYAAQEWVFRGVSFGLEPGTVTSVLGPNGRGKTTLVRCAAGLLDPQEGEVRREAPTGFVPQARGTAFAFPVREMVVMGRAAHVGVFAVPGRRDRAAADAAMDRVGIVDLADRAFPTLSGGEQQLVLVARAVASGHPVMVLDEPATGLDLRNQGVVLALVRSLADDGLTVLLTTHHPDHALFVSDAVVLMRGPRDVRHGRAADLLSEAELSALYGVPVHEVDVPGGEPRRRALVTGYTTEPGRLPLS